MHNKFTYEVLAMKRSKINASIRWAEELCKKNNITLPVFAGFAPDKKNFNSPEKKQ